MFNFIDGINQVFGVKYILCIWKWLLLIVYFFVIIEMYIKDYVCG